MISLNTYLAFLKYDGTLIDDGILDARKSSLILSNFDEITRYFLIQENPELMKYNFEIPVLLKQNSWDVFIPDNLDELFIKGILTWSTAKYFGSALGEMAKNDFKDIGFKDLFKKAFEAITWTLRLGKHRKGLKKNKMDNLKFAENNELIGVPDENGNYLYVPKKYLDIFIKCPEYLFSGITSIIEPERKMSIGIYNDKKYIINVNFQEKEYFVKKEEDTEETVLPELQHNEYIELEGHVTKGNEKSNNLGFLYQGHILTAKPINGSIVQYKNELFTQCLIKGYIDRTDKFGRPIEKRPKIIFTELNISDNNSSNSINLFE